MQAAQALIVGRTGADGDPMQRANWRAASAAGPSPMWHEADHKSAAKLRIWRIPQPTAASERVLGEGRGDD